MTVRPEDQDSNNRKKQKFIKFTELQIGEFELQKQH